MVQGSDDDNLDREQPLPMNDDNAGSPVGKMLTSASVDSLCKLVKEQHSLSALTRLVNAYRAACHSDSKATGVNDGIRTSDTLCKILMFMLHEADTTFRKLLGIQSSSSRKEAVLDLKNTTKWLSLRPLIKSYLRSTMFLLNQVTDSEILAFSICRLRASVIFLAAFPSLLHKLLKVFFNVTVVKYRLKIYLVLIIYQFFCFSPFDFFPIPPLYAFSSLMSFPLAFSC